MNLPVFLNGLNEIIGYTGDKEEFNNKFITIIYDKAVSECLKKFPEEQQNLISEEFRTISDSQQLQEAVNKHFLPEDFNIVLKNSSQNVIEDYLDTIETELSEEQKTRLQQYFASQIADTS